MSGVRFGRTQVSAKLPDELVATVKHGVQRGGVLRRHGITSVSAAIELGLEQLVERLGAEA